jgi:hypothetical protein
MPTLQVLDLMEATQSKRLVLSASQSLDNFWAPVPAPVPVSPVPTSEPHALSLILLDEADIVFEDDKGFEAAMISLIDAAKCPIVLTSNSMSSLLVLSQKAVHYFARMQARNYRFLQILWHLCTSGRRQSMCYTCSWR